MQTETVGIQVNHICTTLLLYTAEISDVMFLKETQHLDVSPPDCEVLPTINPNKTQNWTLSFNFNKEKTSKSCHLGF